MLVHACAGWAAGLTVVFAMPLSVYAGLLDLLIVLPAEVDRERSCTEYGICDDWSWGNADWMSLAAFVFIAGCVAIATRAVAAVRYDQWASGCCIVLGDLVGRSRRVCAQCLSGRFHGVAASCIYDFVIERWRLLGDANGIQQNENCCMNVTK